MAAIAECETGRNHEVGMVVFVDHHHGDILRRDVDTSRQVPACNRIGKTNEARLECRRQFDVARPTDEGLRVILIRFVSASRREP
jgi:hypothetical protein